MACGLVWVLGPVVSAQPGGGAEGQLSRGMADGRPYITFAVNAHDWRCIDESADTVLRLIGIFQKCGTRGDFYLTAPVVERYAEERPEVVRRLKDGGMTISYHVRAPHPLWRGFSGPLSGKEGSALEAALLDYELHGLDLRTGQLDRGRPGGYAYVAEVFGRKPVAVGSSDAAPSVKAASGRVYAALGARVGVFYHESGTRPEQPFEFRDGLLVRSSDFSVTRFETPGDPRGIFWWNMVGTPREKEFDPVDSLDRQIAAWAGSRAPFITALIHENDFYREGGPGWNSIYFDGEGPRSRPRRAPFDLDASLGGAMRPEEVREAIFRKYEALVEYASTRLRIVTSEDIAALAGQPTGASSPGRVEVAPMATDRPAAVRRPPGPRLVASGEGGAFVRIPSEAARPEGIAAMVYLPREGRYAEGVPVVIHVHGGVDAGGARGRSEYVGQGFAEIRFAFPGGGRGDERSGGNYDFRGPGCIRAVADVIRFAMGKIAATDGRRIGEMAGPLTILTNNVGVVGSSHGGNAAVMAMALHGSEFPELAWYASMESPFGEGAANVELGGRESGLNPAYDPKTGAIDLARLAWSEELAPMLRRGPAEAMAPQARGALFFDMDGDGRFREGVDFPVRCHFGDAGDGAKAWYSPRLLDEVERRHILSGPRPDHLPTASQSRVFWGFRDAAPSIPDAIRQCPRLAVIVYANERDHVQADPAHTHIITQVEGFRKAGARFVRLNPDRQYVLRLAPPSRQAIAFPDNPAGKPWSRDGIVAGLEPAAFPVGLYMQAAVAELADRTRADEWSPDLRAVLVPEAPAPPGAARK